MFSYIKEPVANMRQEPNFSSQVVSQALFAEKIALFENWEKWSFIETSDGYRGWILSNAISRREEPYFTNMETCRLSAHLYSQPDIKFGPLMTLPFGIGLLALQDLDSRWIEVEMPGKEKGYIQRGDTGEVKKSLPDFVKQFLDIPYTWGGRSSFGYDCSGFVQMVYKRLGVLLPRDSKDQFLDGNLASCSIENLNAGDLIFWGKSEKEIGHVGIFLGSGSFIHSSARENKPYLRVSGLSDPEWLGNKNNYYPFRMGKKPRL